jgi:hypothetical protein
VSTSSDCPNNQTATRPTNRKTPKASAKLDETFVLTTVLAVDGKQAQALHYIPCFPLCTAPRECTERETPM